MVTYLEEATTLSMRTGTADNRNNISANIVRRIEVVFLVANQMNLKCYSDFRRTHEGLRGQCT